jgi:putative ABC transport system permease protein
MRLLRRLAYWVRLRSNQQDLLDEVAFHREMVERDLVRSGAAPAAARAAARRMMGNETFMREEARAIWLRPSLEALWQDARYTLRNLAGNPVFSLGVILTLALGIGANTAMFSFADRLLLRSPARMIDPGSVHRAYLYVTSRNQERETGGQYARYADLLKSSTAFSQIAAYRLERLAIGMDAETRLRNVAIVSASFFEFFDAPPILGRYFERSEDVPPTGIPLAVLSHAIWTTQFNARRDILGQRVRIDAVSYEIIGVAPDGFVGLWPFQPPAAFVPVATFAASRGEADWATTYSDFIGIDAIVRRRPGISNAVANADLTNAFRRSLQIQISANPETPPLDSLRPRAVAASVLAERGPERSSVARVSTWLAGVTLIVLLIACANVANLMLARTIRRRREIAVRIALGVSRRRLFSQLLTEGVLLALLGGAAGVVLAIWGSRVLSATFLPQSERVSLISDSRTLLFTGAVALTVGVLTGMASMTHAWQGSLIADLKSAVREGTYRRNRMRTSLLLLQSALSLVLLVAAGLFVQSLRHVREVRLGFDADSVVVASLEMRDVKLDSGTTVALRLRLLDAVKEVPGVSHASLQYSTPFDGASSYPLFVAGIDSVRRLGRFDFNAGSADYFKTMGTRIVRGRGFENTDREGTQQVVVVGQSMANRLWLGQEPIGQCIRIGSDTLPCRRVVGVAEDIHSQSIDDEPKLFFYYLPASQWRPHVGGLFVRTHGNPRRLMEAMRDRLQREMPGASFVTVTPLGDIVGAAMRSWVVGAKIFTVFGLLALVLAAVGLYSVIAYDVTQRRHELGVRLALGAATAGIMRLVVTESLRLALAGAAVGAIGALAGGRWIGPLLFRQSPHDPGVFAFVAAVLIAVAIAASWIPAWRAARADPMTALRTD